MDGLLYKPDKSRADIECLLQEHKNLVYYMLTKTGQLANQDAESAAWEALWDALNLFDIYGTTKFSTYACTLMRNAIYDVLRKQKPHKNVLRLIDDFQHIADYTDFFQSSNIQTIETAFKSYCSKRRGLAKDILLVWYGASFEISQREIAERCHCSISYVGRAQQGFRAFLSGKLKEQ